jgi:hypothetical protein
MTGTRFASGLVLAVLAALAGGCGSASSGPSGNTGGSAGSSTGTGGTGGSAGSGTSGSLSGARLTVVRSIAGGQCPRLYPGTLGGGSDNGNSDNGNSDNGNSLGSRMGGPFRPSSTVPVGDVTALIVCPQRVPGTADRVVRLARGDGDFQVLLAALAKPSAAPAHGRACPLFADVLQIVLAQADGRWFMVKLPTDGCGHYFGTTLSLLTRLRN